MDTTKAELEDTIRDRRAELERKLARLEARYEAVKHASRDIGRSFAVVLAAGAAVLAFAFLLPKLFVTLRR